MGGDPQRHTDGNSGRHKEDESQNPEELARPPFTCPLVTRPFLQKSVVAAIVGGWQRRRRRHEFRKQKWREEMGVPGNEGTDRSSSPLWFASDAASIVEGSAVSSEFELGHGL